MGGGFVVRLVLLMMISVVVVEEQAVEAKFMNRKSSTSSGSCDLFRGRWVYDPSYPLYNSTDCPFILKEFDCQKNGRPDKEYVKYTWKPSACNLPRYLPTTT